jgi:hypothetical protein
MSSSTNTYDTNSDTFKISPTLVLGVQYEQYLEELYLICVSKPALYAECRANIIQKVKMGVVKDLYADLRDVLCKGELHGNKLIRLDGKTLVPNHPPQSSDEIILGICKSLDKELTDIIAKIIPPFSQILKGRLEAQPV